MKNYSKVISIAAIAIFGAVAVFVSILSQDHGVFFFKNHSVRLKAEKVYNQYEEAKHGQCMLYCLDYQLVAQHFDVVTAYRVVTPSSLDATDIEQAMKSVSEVESFFTKTYTNPTSKQLAVRDSITKRFGASLVMLKQQCDALSPQDREKLSTKERVWLQNAERQLKDYKAYLPSQAKVAKI